MSVRDPRRERLSLASLSFFLTAVVTRLLTLAFRTRVVPFPGVWMGGIRVHHLVWGILLLLGVGYAWLVQIGTGTEGSSIAAGRLMAVLYGAGAALTLDEFALAVNLQDVYWARQGRTSVDAVVLFGALVSMGLWGGPILRGLSRQSSRVFRGR